MYSFLLAFLPSPLCLVDCSNAACVKSIGLRGNAIFFLVLMRWQERRDLGGVYVHKWVASDWKSPAIQTEVKQAQIAQTHTIHTLSSKPCQSANRPHHSHSPRLSRTHVCTGCSGQESWSVSILWRYWTREFLPCQIGCASTDQRWVVCECELADSKSVFMCSLFFTRFVTQPSNSVYAQLSPATQIRLR